MSVTADIIKAVNRRADVEKCAVFTKKTATPVLDNRRNTKGNTDERLPQQYGTRGGGGGGGYTSAAATFSAQMAFVVAAAAALWLR